MNPDRPIIVMTGPHWPRQPAKLKTSYIRSPTNMAAAKIAAVDFSKMTSLDRPACGHVVSYPPFIWPILWSPLSRVVVVVVVIVVDIDA